MKGIIKHTLKKVTLELVYQVVDERTTELIQKIDEVKRKQEDDFRYLVQKIDNEIGSVRNEIGQLRTEIGALNQRIDTIIQMLMTLRTDQK
ncbi:MAG: hypothetical protein DWB56_01755 [Candidatus Jettenia sp.]|uniref:Uncharacterized protein n=1 Tax=Candidatus Jettenia caeni TaxID=247490 RepID=I3ILE3_9BACT|nr:hypothetical protein [Candidatus Jettenia sp. AMX1]MBC6927681.1 hypothetical protein [Candidatus Jettenia sp.]WKZ14375.1 MAG: hypothetical protein QY317_10710 [Candidatus Jettenia caeni]KAA0250049.1 MAG: hypothetical protein EDM77_06240 [Candidatus Jettenia sp. AMX1]MCE7880131.1 hypothetical protein [Candidatus Jettenia sp. AMX1]MCQ3926570.1 hypothetical protein [Candidatus Jettenia sp.]